MYFSGPDFPGGQNQVIVGQIPGQGSQGLLMPVTSAGQLATSVGASLSTSVVPTSAIQSVMTTQVGFFISWAKLEVSAQFQSAQHVHNMFSFKSVNDTNNARPKDSKKNGNFKKKKKKFTPK